jgi:selenocysteine-specific elongation factor
MIVGTAGHIDHGKTSLVKALTGVDADRLPEEKVRGITLDLGYAYVPLPDGEVLGFVDVPGHERLVHNMLAGATGIDYVLLVVAADDGPMPQTREHLQILDLLGLNRGAVALTKIDAVSPERREQASREIAELMLGTGLADVPLFPVSSVSGEGIEALRAELTAAAASQGVRATPGHFRLAIDRCFTLKGTGTVVTGTVHSGRARVDEELVLSPPGIRVRVRSIHAQDRPAQQALAGQRCALNLAGPDFGKEAVERGQWVLSHAAHAPTQRLDVRVRLLAAEPKPMRHWTPVHVHLGAIDVTGRAALLEGDELEAGGSGRVQLVLDRPIGALRGDRFILRDQSATRALGGGIVLDPFPPQRGRRGSGRLRMLRALEEQTPERALAALLETGVTGVDLLRFALTWNLRAAELDSIIAGIARRRVCAGDGIVGFAEASWTALKARMVEALNGEHLRAPDMIGVGRERLRRLTDPSLSQAAFEVALAELLAAGQVKQTGSWLHHPDHQVRLTASEEKQWGKVRPLLEETPFHPPRVRDLAKALLVEEGAMRVLLKRVSRLGEVYPVAHDHYFARGAVTQLARIIRDLDALQGGAEAAAFRDRIQTGRKLAIQILEFFDRIGYTRRVGDRHVVRQPDMFGQEQAHPMT